MSVFIGFICFLAYVFSTVKVGELLINQSPALFMTGLIGWFFGFPLLVFSILDFWFPIVEGATR